MYNIQRGYTAENLGIGDADDCLLPIVQCTLPSDFVFLLQLFYMLMLSGAPCLKLGSHFVQTVSFSSVWSSDAILDEGPIKTD